MRKDIVGWEGQRDILIDIFQISLEAKTANNHRLKMKGLVCDSAL